MYEPLLLSHHVNWTNQSLYYYMKKDELNVNQPFFLDTVATEETYLQIIASWKVNEPAVHDTNPYLDGQDDIEGKK